jgi:hypothetical protein
VIVVASIPLAMFVKAQFIAYTNRSSGLSGLVPGQAGTVASSSFGTISIYSVGANLIWAIWGYHADGTMAQIAALWPLAMLGALVMLGRGRSRASLLLAALVVVPIGALFLVGSRRPDLFELRYFCGAVPVALLLAARFISATNRRSTTTVVAAVALVGTMAVGLVDQQINGANPRLYDFEGALSRVQKEAEPGDVILFEPVYLDEVIGYYAPTMERRPIRRLANIPADATVWVVATDRVTNSKATAANIGSVLATLEETRTIVDHFERPNVKVWELE